MEITILILIIIFGYILAIELLKKNFIMKEPMTNLGDLSSKIGENLTNISNMKDTLNNTLTRAKNLNAKIDGIKKQAGFNSSSDEHPSVKSLNVKPKKTECFTGLTQNQYTNLSNKNQSNLSNIGSLKSICTQIENEIKIIKNKL